jgi:hypothetical protein
MPIYPQATEVHAPRTKEEAVSVAAKESWLHEMSEKIRTAKPATNMAQILYSAYKKASAPVEIASYTSFNTANCFAEFPLGLFRAVVSSF